jgi:hypothetical protein
MALNEVMALSAVPNMIMSRQKTVSNGAWPRQRDSVNDFAAEKTERFGDRGAPAAPAEEGGDASLDIG